MNQTGGFHSRAKRSLGQNFLVDNNICERIVAAVDPGPEDLLVEIGPGRGALTRFFVDLEISRYIALEKDHSLAAALAEQWPGIEVVDGDALQYPWESLDGPGLKVAGNLPYNVASRIIWDLVSRLRQYAGCVFMVQHEVALRLAASPGGRQYGALSAWVQGFAKVDYLFKVPPTVFRPQPKVDSAVVRFSPVALENRPKHPEALAGLLKLCFQKRRKQLGTILKPLLNQDIREWFGENDIELSARPETLSPGQFSALSVQFSQTVW